MSHRFLFARSVVSVVPDALGPRRQTAGRGVWRNTAVAWVRETTATRLPAAYAKIGR
jgi:hypothetical protein